MGHTYSGNDRVKLEKSLRFFELLRSLDPRIPIGAVSAFLLIAERPNMSVTELAAGDDAKLSTISRYQNYLGKKNRKGGPGLGLVCDVGHPTDTRRKSLALTPLGEKVANQMTAIFTGKPYTQSSDGDALALHRRT